MWRFLMGHSLALTCLLPNSRLSSVFPCMFSFFYMYVSTVCVSLLRDSISLEPFFVHLALFHNELLFPKAYGRFRAKDCCKWLRAWSWWWRGTSLLYFLIFDGQAGLWSRHMPFWHFLVPLQAFGPVCHSLVNLSQRVNVCLCRGQFSNVLHHLIITSACISGGAKSSEVFLRRKSERTRGSQLEETTKTMGYCLSY